MNEICVLNKFNVELVLQAILWYGTGNHSQYTSIKIDLLKDIFNITTAVELQNLYNILGQHSERIYGVCFADGTVEMYPIKECNIHLLGHDISLANRSIICSFKDNIDNATTFITEFFTDLRDYYF